MEGERESVLPSVGEEQIRGSVNIKKREREEELFREKLTRT